MKLVEGFLQKQVVLARDNFFQFLFHSLLIALFTTLYFQFFDYLPTEFLNLMAMKWLIFGGIVNLLLIALLKKYFNIKPYYSFIVLMFLGGGLIYLFFERLFLYGIVDDNSPKVIVFYPDNTISLKFQNQIENGLLDKLPKALIFEDSNIEIKPVAIPFSGHVEKSILGKEIEGYGSIMGYIEVVEEGMFMKSTFVPMKPYAQLGIKGLGVRLTDFPSLGVRLDINFPYLTTNLGVYSQISPASYKLFGSIVGGIGFHRTLNDLPENAIKTNSVVNIKGASLGFSVEESIYHLISSYLSLHGESNVYCNFIERKLSNNFHQDILPLLSGDIKRNILGCLPKFDRHVTIDLWKKLKFDSSIRADKIFQNYLLNSELKLEDYKVIIEDNYHDLSVIKSADNNCKQQNLKRLGLISCLLESMVKAHQLAPFRTELAEQYLFHKISELEDSLIKRFELYYFYDLVSPDKEGDYQYMVNKFLAIEQAINTLKLSNLSCEMPYYLLPLLNFESITNNDLPTIDSFKLLLADDLKKNSIALGCPSSIELLDPLIEQFTMVDLKSELQDMLLKDKTENISARQRVRDLLSLAIVHTTIVRGEEITQFLSKLVSSNDIELARSLRSLLKKLSIMTLGAEQGTNIFNNLIDPLLNDIFIRFPESSFTDIILRNFREKNPEESIDDFVHSYTPAFKDYVGQQLVRLPYAMTGQYHKAIARHPYPNKLLKKFISLLSLHKSTKNKLDITAVNEFLKLYPNEKEELYIQHLLFDSYVRSEEIENARELIKVFEKEKNGKEGFYQFIIAILNKSRDSLCGKRIEDPLKMSFALLDKSFDEDIWTIAEQYKDNFLGSNEFTSIDKFHATLEVYLAAAPILENQTEWITESYNCKNAHYSLLY